jgi:hypothetical protein
MIGMTFYNPVASMCVVSKARKHIVLVCGACSLALPIHL